MCNRGGDEGFPHAYVVAKKCPAEFSQRTFEARDGFYLVRLKRNLAHSKLFSFTLQKELGDQGANICGRR
jgi:hypothetical protein